ncbi:hemoglobin subunit alpha-5-like [Pyxicephalus adspersus]|uniref:hemoglobin subunit alpha-5-like n=1 Tax=Pyxicephalus adspersus TaxID=30357 RepID=UPI003B5C20C9
MTFSEAEKAAITSLWSKISGHADDIGAEALERMIINFPHTKTYFSHVDLSHGSADLRRHGGSVMKAIGNAAQHLGDIDHALSGLSDLPAQDLMVDPGNSKLLSQSIQVTLAAHFPKEFNPTTNAAWDKFLDDVFTVYISKYR